MKNDNLDKFINKIKLGNCLEELKKIPSKSIDLIFADPPYFMQTGTGTLYRINGNKYNGVDDEWDKFDSYKEYDKFTRKWLTQCRRILKDKGSIWVMGTFHNIYRLGYIIQDLNFWIINDITWEKTNPTPNFRGTKFVNSNENLIWFTKSQNSKFTFNYKTMKNENKKKQMGSVWKFSICSGKERLKDNNGNKLHNTQKPEDLLRRIILASTKINDVILDPFFGTGTTGAVAKKLHRNFIGIENNEKYINYANDRIKNVDKISKNDPFFDYIKAKFDEKIKYPKILDLIRENKIKSKYLYNLKEDKVYLNSEGKIKINNVKYSIHKATEIFENGRYLNGWKYWYIKEGNNYISIDDIRKDVK
ncbi:Modification methylase DpnIIB [Candidatus Hepatoplasma crinochetorum Av]|uniref:Methyltransferase n=1 Tax=Candidatus Hepatoplasma crinochetorum Av TaxID=1427984 RepID=W8GK26_9MOLU|nr:site-specific DNA-methyltransferase [Candidatus Hepatoplasma crinochetorum]AHK22597.1 Modification methylase DpnIIB [Candidatus Hepatoplasma crinochetorum Av]